MSVSFSVKQGATFLLHGVCVQDDGTAIDLTGAAMTCELRGPYGTVAGAIEVVPTDPSNGVFNMLASSAATASWPIGRLLFDVCFVQSGVVIYSETCTLAVSSPATPAPGSTP